MEDPLRGAPALAVVALQLCLIASLSCGGPTSSGTRPVRYHAEDDQPSADSVTCRVVNDRTLPGAATLAPPALTRTPEGITAVWLVRHDGLRLLRAQRLDGRLDPLGEAVDFDPGVSMPIGVRAAECDGRLHLAWQGQGVDGDSIQTLTVGGDGSQPRVITVASQGRQPALACAGEQLALVWSARQRGIGDVFLRWLGRGDDHTAPLLLSGESSSASRPTIACSETRCAVAWSDGRQPFPEIFAFVLDSGTREVPTSRRVSEHAQTVSGAGGAYGPSAATVDGERYLIAWYDSRSGDESEIYAASLEHGSPASTERRISRSPSPSTSPIAVSCREAGDAVVWRDRRGGPPTVVMAALDRRSRRSSAALPLSLTADQTSSPSAVCSPATDGFVIAWTEATTDENGARARGALRVVDVRCR
jgi:hypothetical protein